MKLVKIFFITTLVFLNAMCAAEATTILAPIMSHFSEASSKAKLLSKRIIEQQKVKGKQFEKKDVDDFIAALKEKEPDFFDDMFAQCMRNVTGATYSETYAKAYKNAWNMKVANCGGYAFFVLIAFEFNKMNVLAQDGKKPIFKTARLVMATANGDHALVLVEGNSGRVFAVDPWMGVVKKLSTRFAGLDLSRIPIDQSVDLNPEENQQLNLLFSEPFYDVEFVNKDTEWEIEGDKYKIIYEVAHKYDTNMESFYNTLRPNFQKQWIFEYAKLFPKCGSPADKNKLEECKGT
jgi:hypothetical protein